MLGLGGLISLGCENCASVEWWKGGFWEDIGKATGALQELLEIFGDKDLFVFVCVVSEKKYVHFCCIC